MSAQSSGQFHEFIKKKATPGVEVVEFQFIGSGDIATENLRLEKRIGEATKAGNTVEVVLDSNALPLVASHLSATLIARDFLKSEKQITVCSL